MHRQPVLKTSHASRLKKVDLGGNRASQQASHAHCEADCSLCLWYCFSLLVFARRTSADEAQCLFDSLSSHMEWRDVGKSRIVVAYGQVAERDMSTGRDAPIASGNL